MVTTRPPKTIVKPTDLGPVVNTDTKLLIYGLFQKGRVLAQDDIEFATLEWVHWYNTQRLLEPIGNVAPVEYEMNYYRSQEGSLEMARLN